MLPILLAAATASCTVTPAMLLDANRRAVLAGGAERGTGTLRYDYAGQGMTGTSEETFDLATGRFVDRFRIGPSAGSNGYDGRQAWQQDLSLAYLPEGGGDRPALGANEAYRDANLWWRADRDGARIMAPDCGVLRVVPAGGKSFDAWFDPVSHQLTHTREVQGFDVIDTYYSNYVLRAGRYVAGLVEVDVDGDKSNRQTLRLTAFTIAAPVPAAAFAMPVVRPADWSVAGGRVTLPMRLLNNHIYVDARVNGRGPFPFIVDTGGHDIVTPSTAAALSLSAQGSLATSGAGDGKINSGYTHVSSLDAGGAVMRDQTLLALDFSPVDVEGFAVGGMFGVEFMNRFVVEIDYGANRFTIIDPATFTGADRRAAGAAIPFVFYDHMPQVSGSLDGMPTLFNIDTGSRVELTMTKPAVEHRGLRARYPGGVTVTDGWGVGGPSRSYVVRAQTLTLGTQTIARPVVGLSDAKFGAFSDANYDGNIGSGLLKRFVITFDYAHRIMYLRPAATPDADIGRFDRTGLWLNLADTGMKVMDVAADGPAATAGIRVGDVVTAIGGAPVAGRSLSDVRRMLKLAPVGVPLAVDYQRGGVAAAATLTSRNLIPD